MRQPTRLPEDELQQTAKRLRSLIVEAITVAGSGHPGGSLSALEIILTLYSGEMRFDAKEPMWSERDRFVLSKGHGVPALYAVMAERGYELGASTASDKRSAHDKLMTLRKLGSPLQGHPANALLPGIEASTGSLGQGLSVAQGIALAAKIKGGGSPAWHCFCLTGDGELQEGQVWEAAMSAPHLGATNLTVFVDWNKAQIDGRVDEVMPITPLADKWKSFGWQVLEIDGHSIAAIRSAIDAAKQETTKPTVILAHTIKGKGVSFFERDIVGWHGKAPSKEDLANAKKELQ